MRAGPLCRRRGEQQRGQQEVAEVVDAEGELEPVSRAPALAGHAGVVDQDVERHVAGQQLLGGGPHRRQIAEVELEQVDGVVPGRRHDLLEYRLGLGRRPAGQRDRATPPGQLLGRRLADAGVGPGDEERSSAQVAFPCSFTLPS